MSATTPVGTSKTKIDDLHERADEDELKRAHADLGDVVDGRDREREHAERTRRRPRRRTRRCVRKDGARCGLQSVEFGRSGAGGRYGSRGCTGCRAVPAVRRDWHCGQPTRRFRLRPSRGHGSLHCDALAGPTKAPPCGNDASVLPASPGAFLLVQRGGRADDESGSGRRPRPRRDRNGGRRGRHRSRRRDRDRGGRPRAREGHHARVPGPRLRVAVPAEGADDLRRPGRHRRAGVIAAIVDAARTGHGAATASAGPPRSSNVIHNRTGAKLEEVETV